MHQGTVEASTCEGADTFLLVQQLYGLLDLENSLRMAVRIRLAFNPYIDKALHNLGTFTFVASKFFSVGRRN